MGKQATTPKAAKKSPRKKAWKKAEVRPDIASTVRYVVWARAAGRCTLCNRLVTENEDLGEAVPIGELAHNVGWGKDSPRGQSNVDDEARRAAENLLLLCRTCHKPVDNKEVERRYTIEELTERKRQHEERVQFLTSIGADRKAALVRLVGSIRGVQPHLSADSVMRAATRERLYPQRLPGAYNQDCDVDLRRLDASAGGYFNTCAGQIDSVIAKVNDGIRKDLIDRVAVFAFARLPLLLHLGAALDDKVETFVFDRHRGDPEDAWAYPTLESSPSITFKIEPPKSAAPDRPVTLVVNLSGNVPDVDLPEPLRKSDVYRLVPEAPTTPRPGLISSRAVLAGFEQTARGFLAELESSHPTLREVSLLGAIPLSAAVTLGRILMPNVSPAWAVYDRNEDGVFKHALRVSR